VINFDIPRSAETTCTASGAPAAPAWTGEAIRWSRPRTRGARAIERLIKKHIERVLVPGFQPSTGRWRR